MNRYIPTTEELTGAQIGPVLAVIRELTPFLLEEPIEPGGTPTAVNMTGEVSLAASATFIKACARLDGILEDETRYSLKTHEDLISHILKTHRAQQKFIAAQTASTEMLQRPSFALRPTVAVMGDSYVAFWGNIEKSGEAICGIGDTPNKALVDFDKAFDRAPKEQVLLIAESKGIDTNPPQDRTD